MKNLWTTVYVNDLDKSLMFYTEILDLKLDRRFKPNDIMEIAFLGEGETKFELIHNTKMGPVEHSRFVSTGFKIDSVDECMETLKEKGIDVVDGPYQPSPLIKFFFIKDPDGYMVQLVEEISA